MIQYTKNTCPFCTNPKLFDEPKEPSASTSVFIRMSSKVWERTTGQRQIKRFPERTFKAQKRFSISGQEFKEPYQVFTVDVIGMEVKGKLPLMTAGPGFHRVGPTRYPKGTPKRERIKENTVLSFNACRITHTETGIIADAHAWNSHGLLVAVRNLPPVVTKETLAITHMIFDFFTVETRGAPKIKTEAVVRLIQERGSGLTQEEAAKDLGVSVWTLRDWRVREGRTWEEIKKGVLSISGKA
jgi:hypothetical protein